MLYFCLLLSALGLSDLSSEFGHTCTTQSVLKQNYKKTNSQNNDDKEGEAKFTPIHVDDVIIVN